MTKETTKKFRLPAQGKPKPRPKKTSVKALGEVANKQFKAGDKDKKKLTFNPGSTDKQAAEILAGHIKAGKKTKATDKEEKAMRRLARITGV